MTCWILHDRQAAGAGRLRLSRYRTEVVQLLLGLVQVIDPHCQVGLHPHV